MSFLVRIFTVLASAKQAYTRKEVRRVLGISERQLRSWETQDLVAPASVYAFTDLLALRTLWKLRKDKVPASQIRAALRALHEKLRDVRNPLTELRIYAEGKKIHVEIEGHTMEPVTGQLLFDFDEVELNRLLKFPGAGARENRQVKRLNAERWFERGLEMEQFGAPIEDVIHAYLQAVELDPKSAGAYVNLGTIYFNARLFNDAEHYYKKALSVDPNYALAHFDLGNLYDEKGDRAQALTHYQAALALNPNYADAHYNLALLYQTANEVMTAVRHWTTYLKLDPVSSWASIARRELAKLHRTTVVTGAGKKDNSGS